MTPTLPSSAEAASLRTSQIPAEATSPKNTLDKKGLEKGGPAKDVYVPSGSSSQGGHSQFKITGSFVQKATPRLVQSKSK
jgi:hypothetical protein